MKLEKFNKFGYYEIRLESVGGLGANLLGHILGELGGIYLDLYAMSFSSYGSEKRGSPVESFIRYSNKEILTNEEVKNPDILCIFHENLLNESSLKGDLTNSILIINTSKKKEEIENKINKTVKEICTIDGIKFANLSNARLNIILLGAIARKMDFIDVKYFYEIIKNVLGKKYPNSVENNIKGFDLGYKNLKSEKPTRLYNSENKIKMILWGYDNQPIGGVNYIIGNNVSNDLSQAREGYVPKFIKERCINCGLCDATCPDYVFQFKTNIIDNKTKIENVGLNYHHCKGCMKCVHVCPTHALVSVKEEDYDVLNHTVNDLDVLVKNIDYNYIGSSSYITSESKDNIKNMKGGHF